ncbi:MAG: NADH-quinone oxidoreductase subunit 15 [Deinococcaceae bacterium]
MSHAHDERLYTHWLELLGWAQSYALEHGLEFVKVSDFPDYIYRMERTYSLPTTLASASVNENGHPLLLLAVSPRHVALKAISIRLMGGLKHWHLHAGEQGLLEGKQAFTREHFFALMDGARKSVSA